MSDSNTGEVKLVNGGYAIKKRPPPPVQRPTYTDIVFHRRNNARTQYYFTSGHERWGEATDLSEMKSPFEVPECNDLVEFIPLYRAKRRDRAMGIAKRSTRGNLDYGEFKSRDLMRRLRVDVEIEAEEAKRHKELSKMIAMSDIDPKYYKELSVQKVKEKFSLSSYVNDVRSVFKTKLTIGQRRDEIIRIEQQSVEEQRRMDQIKNRYRQYVEGFEDLLERDHSESADILEEADQENKISIALDERLKQLEKEYGQIRLDVYFWEEKWRMVKMCQIFLFRVAPKSWRVEHDWIHKIDDRKNDVTPSTDELFAEYQLKRVTSLEDLIAAFERDIDTAGPLDLYFEDPADLLCVFRAIEMQNLHAFIHLETLAAPMAEMTSSISEAEKEIREEIKKIEESIASLEAVIVKTEERASKLEEYANYLTEGIFRELVCSEEVLQMTVFIEDAYETCVGPNDANLNSFEMMKRIEKEYEKFNLLLDNLPADIVRASEKECYREIRNIMKEAQEAAKKLKLEQRLLSHLRRILEPPFERKRQLMWRSPPIFRREAKKQAKPLPTTEEIDQLYFFTNEFRCTDT